MSACDKIKSLGLGIFEKQRQLDMSNFVNRWLQTLTRIDENLSGEFKNFSFFLSFSFSFDFFDFKFPINEREEKWNSVICVCLRILATSPRSLANYILSDEAARAGEHLRYGDGVQQVFFESQRLMEKGKTNGFLTCEDGFGNKNCVMTSRKWWAIMLFYINMTKFLHDPEQFNLVS